MLIGAHVDPADPIGEARARHADVAQFFLADPQGWTAPRPREDADALRASDVVRYVHAPYVLNVATSNNKIRIPSRKLLSAHADAAAAIGAAGLIVHGGHVNAADDPELGVDNWRKTFERAEFALPVLIENTAGGRNAMARHFDRLARLWDVVGPLGAAFCLDTCHAHAAGEDLADVVERALAITGRIDLVHANDSRDAAGSGADRHANLGSGEIGLAPIAAVVTAAGAPVVVETPGGVQGQAADIAALR